MVKIVQPDDSYAENTDSNSSKNRMKKQREDIDVLSFSIKKSLSEGLTDVMDKMGYSNRSEIMRDAIRNFINENEKFDSVSGIVEGVIVALYLHTAEHNVHRILHKNSKIIRSFLHVDFEENCKRCCDIIVFKGEADKLRLAINDLQSTVDVVNVNVVIN